ncbi:uncharacterized protein ATNIH1004_005754 [Aspergillus tanneri]|uniref:Uncharacterized protein n=1 Tax=Aspergillus tanneri TaxID=1220188 RepID=A0A5M9MJ82_9EURO|nr:uncharacterized protein ATNIH1004_005754 [Aspergillus tanneri]KAA8647071.1 hypothetical protein ATNIH1004_005754 [Aspergillus tanneri]
MALSCPNCRAPTITSCDPAAVSLYADLGYEARRESAPPPRDAMADGWRSYRRSHPSMAPSREIAETMKTRLPRRHRHRSWPRAGEEWRHPRITRMAERQNARGYTSSHTALLASAGL